MMLQEHLETCEGRKEIDTSLKMNFKGFFSHNVFLKFLLLLFAGLITISKDLRHGGSVLGANSV